MAHRSEMNKAFRQLLEVLIENGPDGMARAMEILFNEAMKLERSVHCTTVGNSNPRRDAWMPTVGNSNPRRDARMAGSGVLAGVGPRIRCHRVAGMVSGRIKRMELILSWPHSGFNVHIGEAIAANDEESLTRVARYMLRAPVMLSRISYDREQQTVRIGPQRSRGGGPAVLDVLDFVARLTVQIPDPHERLVLYYGPYSNASEAAQGIGR